MVNAKITSVGSYTPETVMTNKDFEKIIDTTDDWIVTRTGIHQRHIVPRDEHVPASQLGMKAARIALEKVNCHPSDVDGIICATFTPDSFFPSTACRMQALLGCQHAFAVDISAACAGFVYALSMAASLIRCGQCKKILVVGAEVTSKTLDWTDRSTCILFGDGAGAVLVEASDDQDHGIITSYLLSDGKHGDILILPSWGEPRFIQMKGNEVFKHAVRLMGLTSRKVITDAKLTIDDIDFFIPHQANVRIIDAVAKQLKLPQEKVVCNVDRFGNTSSASIPIALDEIWSKGGITNGKIVLFTGLGGGITAGSTLVRF